VIGTLAQNTIVDAVVALSDKSWIQVKRSDGTTGWCLGSSLSVYTPPTTIDQTGIQYQVNVATLNMYQTYDSTSAVIGTLAQNTIVDAVVALSDKSWIQVKRSDGTTGWCLGSSLSVYTPPAPTTIDLTGLKYQVNSLALNMRSGPGITYNILGTLTQGEVVDGVVALADKSWLQVKRSDGLIGWSSGAYLVLYTPPPPPPANQVWYKVTAATLNVRSTPSATGQQIGYLQKDDVVSSLATSSDGGWAQINRIDGLTGWCSMQFLTNLGNTTPGSWNQKIFTGVTYFHKETMVPHSMTIHALGIDLQAPNLQFLVTPPARQTIPPLCTQKTSEFLAEYGLQVAVNGDAFYYQDPTAYPSQTFCPGGGDPVIPDGYTASRGTVYYQKSQVEPVLFISRINRLSFVENNGRVQAPSNVWNAISGDRMLVKNGQPVPGLEATRLDPRTAIGLSKDERFVIIVVVDGRETSIGATFAELAPLMVSFGCYTAMALDGGGSSTMVIQGLDGKPRILNTPVDDGIAGHERAVGNHLGIFVKKL
jgi:exopolysaccharide biosynthesis protein